MTNLPPPLAPAKRVQPTSRLAQVKSAHDGAVQQISPLKLGRQIVPLELIDSDEADERKNRTEAHVLKIMRSMDAAAALSGGDSSGQEEPAIGTLLPNGRVKLISGHTRREALKRRGKTEMELILRPAEAEGIRRAKSLMSNLCHEDLSVLDAARGVKDALAFFEGADSQQKLADIIGMDKSWVSSMLRILTLPDVHLENLEKSGRPLQMDALVNIARVEDPGEQERLVQNLLNGATVREIRQQIPRKGKGGLKAKKPGKSGSYTHKAKNGLVVTVTARKGSKLEPEALLAAFEEALASVKGT